MPNIPVISQVKVIKQLFLDKLDLLIVKTSSIFDFLVKEINEKTVIINQRVNILLENDSFLLQYGVDMAKSLKILLESLKTNQAENQQQQELALYKIETIEKSMQQLLSSNKTKVIISDSQNIEISLLNYLYSFLPSRCALDIGANVGELSSALLKVGYQVYALPPFKETSQELTSQLGNNPNFHALPQDDTLEYLHKSAKISETIDLVYLSTRTDSLNIIKGMGAQLYPLVVVEYSDSQVAMLRDIIQEMKQKRYYWYIIIYKIHSQETSYYCNQQHYIENSSGHLFFFQDHHTFTQALLWCSSVIHETYFVSQ